MGSGAVGQMDRARTRRLGAKRLIVAASALLLIPGRAGLAQRNGLAFWEPDPGKVDAVLQANSKQDRERYGILRRSFANFECTGDLMEQQRVSKHDDNLICALPGQSGDRVVVAARYDRDGDGWPTWDDAIMLPLLYHALQAQPRQHTFVFAALHGYSGEKTFFEWLERSGAEPSANIVIENMGLGEPNCYTVRPKKPGPGKDDWGINGMLCGQAAATRRLMGLPASDSPNALADPFANFVLTRRATLFESDLYKRARSAPSALLYSDVSIQATKGAFYQDFDFAAWVLCQIDRKLQAAEPTVAK